jgi:hypothetical protein
MDQDVVRYFGLYINYGDPPLTIEGVDLPLYPKSMGIKAAVEGGRSASFEALNQVMCRVTPKFNAEEKAALEAAGREKVWPWFIIADETVLFGQPDSRWYLAGRAVASYEYR